MNFCKNQHTTATMCTNSLILHVNLHIYSIAKVSTIAICTACKVQCVGKGYV